MAQSFHDLYQKLKTSRLKEDGGGAVPGAAATTNTVGGGAIATFDPLFSPQPFRRKKAVSEDEKVHNDGDAGDSPISHADLLALIKKSATPLGPDIP